MTAEQDTVVIPQAQQIERGIADEAERAAYVERIRTWFSGQPASEIGEPLAMAGHVGSSTCLDHPGLAWAVRRSDDARPATDAERAAYEARRDDPAWKWLYQIAEPEPLPGSAEDDLRLIAAWHAQARERTFATPAEVIGRRIEAVISALPEERPHAFASAAVTPKRTGGLFGRRVTEPAPVLEGRAEIAMRSYEADGSYPDDDEPEPGPSHRRGKKRGWRRSR